MNRPTEKHVPLFEPVLLEGGRIERLDLGSDIDLILYLMQMDDDDPLRSLFEPSYLLCSLVAPRDERKDYDQQMRWTEQIANQCKKDLSSFHGVLFYGQGRIYGILSLQKPEEEVRIRAALERITDSLWAADCPSKCVSFGQLGENYPLERAMFQMDQVWRYFNFLEDKPNVYHMSKYHNEPKGFDSWEACWKALQKRMVQALRDKDLNQGRQAADDLVTATMRWGAPKVGEIIIREIQFFDSLIIELLQKNMLGSRQGMLNAEYYAADAWEEKTEKDLRQMARKEIDALHAGCQEYESHKNEQQIQNVKLYITRNIADYELSAGSIARQFHISAESLSSKFRAATQISISEYIHFCRVTRIKELLVSTDMTVEQIMEVVGYFSRSTMYRAFARLTGMTPRDYRAAFQKQGGNGKMNNLTKD